MRKLLIENLEVYEQHRETVEALIAEARALREEECEIAKIFSRLPETLATSELFNHFMRDVHMAHEVFQRRIEHLAAQVTADELQNLRNDKNVLNAEKDAVCKALSTTKQEADRRLAKIREIEQNIDWANNHLTNTQNGVEELWGIKHRLELVTKHALNTRWLTKEDIKDLPNIVRVMVDNLQNISDELDQALKDLSKARNDDLSKARENLKMAKDKYGPIKKRTDKSSALERLVDDLKDII